VLGDFRRARYGLSVCGSPLEVLLPVRGRPAALLFAAIHGEEPDTTVVLSSALRLIRPSELRCAVVLAANPDGVLLGTRGNARGVELNRNWPSSSWQPAPVRHRWDAAHPQSVELSPGETPGSEPEISALCGLLGELRPAWTVALHSPLGLVEDKTGGRLGHWLAERCDLPLVVDVGYACPGGCSSWMNEVGLNEVVLELPRVAWGESKERFAPVLADLLRGHAPLA
jgi:protein MpaA